MGTYFPSSLPTVLAGRLGVHRQRLVHRRGGVAVVLGKPMRVGGKREARRRVTEPLATVVASTWWCCAARRRLRLLDTVAAPGFREGNVYVQDPSFEVDRFQVNASSSDLRRSCRPRSTRGGTYRWATDRDRGRCRRSQRPMAGGPARPATARDVPRRLGTAARHDRRPLLGACPRSRVRPGRQRAEGRRNDQLNELAFSLFRFAQDERLKAERLVMQIRGRWVVTKKGKDEAGGLRNRPNNCPDVRPCVPHGTPRNGRNATGRKARATGALSALAFHGTRFSLSLGRETGTRQWNARCRGRGRKRPLRPVAGTVDLISLHGDARSPRGCGERAVPSHDAANRNLTCRRACTARLTSHTRHEPRAHRRSP